jgi:4-hydroxy-tetrahydrodipicolinate reductase
MRIALIGYGKMGKTIEALALAKGHEIVLKIGSENVADFNASNLKNVDVAIEFSAPHLAFENITTLLNAGIPTVCGTTAWLQDLQAAKDLCIANNTAFIFASNFSIGVNIFFEINKHLATLMNTQHQYQVAIEEIHHTQKLDAPSGTAVTIADGILQNIDRKTNWVNAASENQTELEIISQRIDPAPGTHSVTYNSAIDTIEITHTAHSREGFASGALIAAEYIVNKKGVFEMKDVLEMR